MNYTGFQLGHPETTLPKRLKEKSRLRSNLWIWTQRLLATAVLILLLPFGFIIWVAVKLSSPGKFLFAQKRPGLDGKTFQVYKVRTMRQGSECSTALGVNHSDARVTTVGKILRVLKLDELPQLWNIAKGDMLFVGPRPIPLALDKELREKIPGFENRYQVRPGLTSLGQICVKDNALGDALTEDWKLRFHGELHYIENRSVAYDLLMISMTIIFVLKSLIQR